jgi:excisionase family DNA binding protein
VSEGTQNAQLLLPFGEITVQRAAEILRCSNDTIYRLIEGGEIKAYRLFVGGWWRIEYDSVVDYINRINPRA